MRPIVTPAIAYISMRTRLQRFRLSLSHPTAFPLVVNPHSSRRLMTCYPPARGEALEQNLNALAHVEAHVAAQPKSPAQVAAQMSVAVARTATCTL